MTAIASRERRIVPLNEITVGGVTMNTPSPPSGLKSDLGLGVVFSAPTAVESLHIDEFVCHPRSIVALNGDFLLFFAAGPMHYGWAKKASKGNTMMVRRSSDRGLTWTPTQAAWEVPYSQHAVIPFIPGGSSTIYAFGTEPRLDVYDGEENAAIGFRTSEDDGHTWSPVQLIRPINAPEFRGMSAMRMCETQSGAWVIGTHAGHWNNGTVVTRSYVLRSEDQGESWELVPGPNWDDGWCVGPEERMDEVRPISLGGEKVLLMARTCRGELWELRSDDAGKTWTEPRPTAIPHPDAPPMVFHWTDGKTLAEFHHNRFAPGHFSHAQRTELWVSLSQNDGLDWSEPRFVIANAAEAAILSGWQHGTPMISYADLLVDGNELHLFLDHQMRQILHLHFRAEDLENLPTRQMLRVK